MRGDWDRFERNLEEAGEVLVSVNAPVGYKGSDNWASSDEFRDYLRSQHRNLLVPEHDVTPLIGRANWTPADEAAARVGPCGKCRNEILPGEDRYCPRCHASGHDLKLERQKSIAGLPPKELPRQLPAPRPSAPEVKSQTCTVEPAESRKTRRQRRAERFAAREAVPQESP